jgi:hypothetical protein
VQAVFDFTKQAIYMPFHGASRMPRLSANLSPNSGHPDWVPPNLFQLPKALTEAEVIEAEAELKALQRHALEVVDSEAESQARSASFPRHGGREQVPAACVGDRAPNRGR